jgi:hypothetical protein
MLPRSIGTPKQQIFHALGEHDAADSQVVQRLLDSQVSRRAKLTSLIDPVSYLCICARFRATVLVMRHRSSLSVLLGRSERVQSLGLAVCFG